MYVVSKRQRKKKDKKKIRAPMSFEFSFVPEPYRMLEMNRFITYFN